MPESSHEVVAAANDRPVYELAFVRRCHQLIGLGYANLAPPTLSAEEEPTITGELVLAMKSVQEGKDAPRWMIYLYIADDPPVNDAGRFGKKRRRVDIEFERSQRGRRPRFQCEAKRLHKSDSLAKYLGTDGLGRFLAGDYSRDEDAAGMLGYVQTRGVSDWSLDLHTALDEDRVQYGISSSGALALAPADLGAEPIDTWRSEHRRASGSRPIAIYHSLLSFLEQ